MNFYAPAHGPAVNDRVLLRIGAGIAVSIALHGLLLFAYRQGVVPPWQDNADGPREALVVTLRAPTAEILPEAAPKTEPEVKPKPALKPTPAFKAEREKTAQAEAATEAPADSIMAPDVIALPETEATAAGAFTVAPPSGPPQFDPDAARKFAREIATKPDPARAGMAVAQIPPTPYATETKAARVIAQAKRADCKDGIPGGLLAPLVLLLDKKDSGCKW
ncbi:hypothetical protein F2P45_11805 [Massilia sp. CCM 8733]|uniref:Energy transducer TonB n=1 Tax=Massilia mucilaginosa TaxID=2609282 RepID=A0ABX0NS09_9BURK|nr:hypothetical protein [Massilia mucilaginosa]NHZ89691.1 hypothetical protein [Massilia mucilaginosa]